MFSIYLLIQFSIKQFRTSITGQIGSQPCDPVCEDSGDNEWRWSLISLTLVSISPSWEPEHHITIEISLENKREGFPVNCPLSIFNCYISRELEKSCQLLICSCQLFYISFENKREGKILWGLPCQLSTDKHFNWYQESREVLWGVPWSGMLRGGTWSFAENVGHLTTQWSWQEG